MTPGEWDLLDRYLAGECTPAEEEQVQNWLAADIRRQVLVEDFRAAISDPTGQLESIGFRKAEAWARLSWEIGTEADAPAPSSPDLQSRHLARSVGRPSFELPTRPRWGLPARTAAAAVLFIASAGAGRVLFSLDRAPEVSAPMQVVTAPRGQRIDFHLPDGTRVLLGAGSTLRRPADFTRSPRDIELEGEAYFEVTHDASRPFTVRARDVVATDLGTAFTVRAYAEDGRARVVVRSGQVALRAAATPSAPERVIAPGQLGRLAPDGSPIVEAADTARLFAWTDGWLVFDDVPLRDALPQLSRWYDLDFRLADSSLGDIRFVARLKNQPTDDALKVLALGLGLRAERHGRMVTFVPAGPKY